MSRDETTARPLLVEIRQSLREERIRRRLSQTDVSSLLGCSRKRVSEFELGLASPSFDFVLEYSSLFGAGLVFTIPDGDHMDFVSA